MRAIGSKEALHRKASDAEQVIYVDKQDQPLGTIARAALREQGLIGRGSFVFLFNPQGELCVHQRTLTKALYPGFWDVCAGGMVAGEESYEASACRELAEELGVDGVPLTFHGKVFFSSHESLLWCAVFSAVSDQVLTLQPEEVQQAHFIALSQLSHWLKTHTVCPDSLQALGLVPVLYQYL